MNTKNHNTKTTILLIIVSLFLLLLLSYGWKAKQRIDTDVPPTLDAATQKNMDAFAQCLAEKKITMYGAAWCTHCKKEKAAFGSSFSYVPYVECPDNIKLCLDKGITSYPTWITEQGIAYEGEQGLETLSGITGCPLIIEEDTATSTDDISAVDTQ
jgi:glutaredoxin